ncbi:MAG: DUF349 domain-containing protein [Bacteroidia bacterium]
MSEQDLPKKEETNTGMEQASNPENGSSEMTGGQEEESRKISDSPEPESTENIASGESPAKSEPEAASLDNSKTEDEHSDESKDDEATHHDEQEDTEDQHDSEEDDQEEADLETMTPEELVEFVEKASTGEDIIRLAVRVRQARSLFEEIVNEEQAAQLASFLEDEENQAEDFVATPNPLRERMSVASRNYRKLRKEKINELNRQKEENLEQKQAILEKLKEITENLSNANHYHDFRSLQDQWRSIGPVPRTEYENLKKLYNFHVHKFFDNLSLYSELKELDRRKNMESKQEIISKVVALRELDDALEAMHQLRTLQKEWKRTGPVPEDDFKSLNEAYKEAVDTIYQRKEKHDEQWQEQREQNLAAKREVLGKLQELAAFQTESTDQWLEKNKELSSWIEEWKKIGSVPKEIRKELSAEFREAVKQFNANKNNFFKERKKHLAEYLREKEVLCEKVEAILQEEGDISQHKREVIKLQDDWKKTKPVQRKYSQKIWNRFRKACDQYFQRLTEANQQQHAEQQENLKAKEAICEKLEELAANPPEDVKEAVKNYQEDFNQIGFVPFKVKSAIQERFQKAVRSLMLKGKFDKDLDPKLMSYALHLDNLVQDREAAGKLDNEIWKLNRDIKRIENDMVTLDNNLAFFSNSKNADKLKKDFEKKIQDYEEEIKTLKQKISMVRKRSSLV